MRWRGIFQQVGYRIIRVNPMADTVLGKKVYRSLRDVAARADVMPIFRHPSAVPPVVKDVIAIGAKVVSMRPSAENEEAAAREEAAGLQAVVGACMMTAHRIVVR